MSDTQQQSQQPYPIITFQGFSTLNTDPSRPAIKDEEMAWCDGFMPFGESQLRVMPDLDPSIFTAPGGSTIGYFASGNISANPYLIVFPTDGSIWAVDTDANTSAMIAAAGTITTTIDQRHIGIAQWGPTYIIIVASQTNGYFLWDGTTFYVAGDSVPGQGTMPTGIQGQAVETYQGRIWVTNLSGCTFSAPQSLTDFTTGSGGGDFTSLDSFLRVEYVQPKQSNGFLYLIADSSINYISNVQTSGSPITTTFTNQNADPESGTPFAGTVTTWGSSIAFVNSVGVQVSYGGRVTKVSQPLDGVWFTAPGYFSINNNFSVGKATVFGKKVLVVLLPIVNPYTTNIENKLFCWDGTRWWSTPQSVALTFIAGKEEISTFTAYGTDGTHIYPLFQTASTSFQKVAQSKLWAKPEGFHVQKATSRVWVLAKYYNAGLPDLTVSIDSEANSSAVTFTPDPLTVTDGYYVSPPTALSQIGNILGVTLTTNAADMALIGVSFDANPVVYRG